MKATKLLLISALLTISMMGMTTDVEASSVFGNKAIYMELEDAVQNPVLLQIMYDQINSSFLGTIDGEYTVTILYNGIMIYITGSYTDWFMFFQMRKLINTQEI